jgi:hypothetical protein
VGREVGFGASGGSNFSDGLCLSVGLYVCDGLTLSRLTAPELITVTSAIESCGGTLWVVQIKLVHSNIIL